MSQSGQDKGQGNGTRQSKRKGLSTLEWIVIAIIALLMISYVLGYWQGIWSAITGQAEQANETFKRSLGNLPGK